MVNSIDSQPHPHARSGFTLVEVAIVLVTIGLLIGGVVGGVALQRHSEMQTVISDYGKYTAAVNNFKAQYGGLPGDLIDATSYWNSGGGTGNATDATCESGVAAAATCNGDGDGEMSDSIEPYLAWQHLAFAKLVEGSFTGVDVSSGAEPGTNVPKSRIKGGGWSFSYKAATSADANTYDQALSNYLAFGAEVSNNITQGALLTPSEAWYVDTKADDGKPGVGRIVTRKPAALANCATSAVDATAEYNLDYKTEACGLNMSLTLK